MAGIVVDGNDVLAVHEASRDAIEKARAGEGPHFLECKTYRWRGHAESRAFADLRPAEEIAEWKKRCPVACLERKLLEEGMVTPEELTDIDRQVLARIAEAVKFAGESPWPKPEDALEDVFSK